ncbi:uncharacterized protein LOC109399259 [Aedes albopictus]|uniref:Uncharacterized protein n=1 Tax=Aedes albopictus TaxID=7160 RepID=A0ABM1Z450_AEDAL
MKLYLAVVCMLGFLSEGVFTMYASLSIGSEGLDVMAASLKSIGPIMTAHYRNLNNARNKIMPKVDGLTEYVNTTYTVLNATYGETQPNMFGVINNVDMFTRQFYYAEQMVITAIGNDLSRLNSELQQTMDQIMQSYSSLLNSLWYQANAESCTLQYTSVTTNLPNQLTKFGACLQTEVDTIPTVVPTVLEMFTLIKNDFISLIKQLKICATTSTNCINEYFNDAHSELMRINMELSLVSDFLHFYQYEAFMDRNQFCGELIKYNVQDITANIMREFGQCVYPW